MSGCVSGVLSLSADNDGLCVAGFIVTSQHGAFEQNVVRRLETLVIWGNRYGPTAVKIEEGHGD